LRVVTVRPYEFVAKRVVGPSPFWPPPPPKKRLREPGESGGGRGGGRAGGGRQGLGRGRGRGRGRGGRCPGFDVAPGDAGVEIPLLDAPMPHDGAEAEAQPDEGRLGDAGGDYDDGHGGEGGNEGAGAGDIQDERSDEDGDDPDVEHDEEDLVGGVLVWALCKDSANRNQFLFVVSQT
jgi:hypothetical protein